MSLRRAWDYMNENDIQTLAVVDEDRHLNGLLTLSDIARFYMEDQDANALAEAKTSYRNLVDVLDGTLVNGELEQFSRTTSRRTTWSSSETATRANCAPSK